MKWFASAVVAMMMLSSGLAQAGEKEARAYCEDAAKVMQLQGEQAAAYVEECILSKLAEDGDD